MSDAQQLGRQGATVLRAEGLSKRYPAITAGQTEIALFQDLNFDLQSGEMVSIVGESGAGKSSLLHLLAALDRPSSGEVWYGTERLSRMSEQQAARYRNAEIGYVWQFHYLLPEFTALENVALPLMARGERRQAALVRAERWLDEVGLADRADHRAGELSGGEQQRVSLARALVAEPKILLADEATGDLDERTAEEVFSLMERLHASHGLASVLVTHNLTFARRCDRTLQLAGKKLLPFELAAHAPVA